MNQSKKKVLLFSDWYFPAYKAGGPVQSCQNIVKALKENYQFYVFTSDRDLGDKHGYIGIQTNTWTEGKNGEYIWYAGKSSVKPSVIRKVMKDVKPDVVYFNSMFSLYFTLLPLWILQWTQFKGRVVLAPRGMLHEGALLRKGMKKKVFLRSFWMSGWPRKLVFHATDEQELNDISKFFPAARHIILAENIPNSDPSPVMKRYKKPDQLKMVFISRVHSKKNLLFLIEQLKAGLYQGNIRLDIFGECDDPHYEKKCRQLADTLPSNLQVSFNGPLPHLKVFETLHNYHLFVLPTLGENFGHAIYEALSSGTPVLISTNTPWRNLESRVCGFDLPLDKPEKYIDAIGKFLAMDSKEFESWSAQANLFAQGVLSNFNSVSKYITLFQ